MHSNVILDFGLPLWAKKMKRQIIAVLGCGDILPFHLIYEGKMSHYLPNYDFPEGFDITCNATHWSNETTMLWYLEKIVFPYVSEKQKKIRISADFPTSLVFENFSGQCTPELLRTIDRHLTSHIRCPHSPKLHDRL